MWGWLLVLTSGCVSLVVDVILLIERNGLSFENIKLLSSSRRNREISPNKGDKAVTTNEIRRSGLEQKRRSCYIRPFFFGKRSFFLLSWLVALYSFNLALLLRS